MTHRLSRPRVAVLIAAAIVSFATAPADARRGGSFGSRGSRTYSAPRQTAGTPRYVPPVERSMTPRTAAQASPGYTQDYRPGFRPSGSRFGGFGGGLIGGLIAGGLIGHMLGGSGGGWGSGGGGGGFLLSLIQLAILGGIVWLVIGFFRRRADRPSTGAGDYRATGGYAPQPAEAPQHYGSRPAAETGPDIPISAADQQAFEQALIDVQDAFGREDYARLRQLTTPEIMSYLSEELSRNATAGTRNEVTGTRLLDAEVSEAWREASGDYATIVMRYESVDVMRDRATGAIVRGASGVPTETTELWTFVRTGGGRWLLSAIQEA